MQEEYKSLLPAELQKTVDLIETRFLRSIDVVVWNTPAASQFLDWDFDLVASQITPASAHILLKDEAVSPHSLFHEIIHIRRFWIEHAPSYGYLENTPQGIANIADRLANDIEHLRVIPEEVAVYPEAADFWRGELGNPARIKQEHLLSARNNLFTGYLAASMALRDDSVANRYHPFLKSAGLLDEAHAFVSDIAQCREQEEVLATAANYLLPRFYVSQTSYQDAANQKYRYEPLPQGRPPSVNFAPEVVAFLNRNAPN